MARVSAKIGIMSNMSSSKSSSNNTKTSSNNTKTLLKDSNKSMNNKVREKMLQSIERLAVVVVTYKRQELLKRLFASFEKLKECPWRIIVVDNEKSERTRQMVDSLNKSLTIKWGSADGDDDGNFEHVLYEPQKDNLGGAGGFSAGVKKAYEIGAKWFWVMDDDVETVPESISRLSKWTKKHSVIQGSRLDYDGGKFYWQYEFLVPMGIPNPFAPAAFSKAGYRVMNTMCFEGGLFRRDVVEKIGFPDPRYFIYWDDTTYGYLASKVTNPIVIPDIVLRRTRDIPNWDIAGIRQLNSTSDMNRYHIMRNRGFMARYFMIHGDYHPLMFAIGTIATAAKEFIRLLAVDRKHIIPGSIRLFSGWIASRKILHDSNWKPMPSLK
ncbi:glycosyltransferase, group 2 family protein [Gardnerella vaginalis]|uniref:Glycosyltransferase, group 2 family protein n=2 Tax=Bifidobacteriaceae TaxID=31953 RepID=A0A135ZA20_GARVA|nr:glycosyltransferase, group 2 family protein [Gardnerella vaginalis]